MDARSVALCNLVPTNFQKGSLTYGTYLTRVICNLHQLLEISYKLLFMMKNSVRLLWNMVWYILSCKNFNELISI